MRALPTSLRAALLGCALLLGAPLSVLLAGGTAAADGGPHAVFSFQDGRITESSGLAASRIHPGVYWTHNDSNDGPYVYAVDGKGRTVATVTLRGIHPRDVEAISLGPDGQIYLGDIGDNLGGKWPEVWIYRFTEPKALHDQTVDAVRYRVQYADGPRDAEALMVQPKTGRVYIASKNEDGGHLYAGPPHLTTAGINVFHSIADVPWVTDGAFSPDGTRLVLRGYFWAAEYTWRGDRPVDRSRLDVPLQEQGEGVTFGADGRSLLFSSEGKGSQVWQETLDGDHLPAGAATAKPSDGSGSAKPGGGGGESGTSGKTLLGFVILAAAVLGYVTLRRSRN
jgi:WD40-like Beta Propeller Repeat